MTKSYRTLLRCCAVCVIGLSSSAVCASDKLLVSNFQSNRIERFSVVSAQSIDRINGGGALSDPLGMTIGPDGHLYVASEGTDQILRLHRDTGALLDVFVGDDPATDDIDGKGRPPFFVDDSRVILGEKRKASRRSCMLRLSTTINRKEYPRCPIHILARIAHHSRDP